MAIDKEKLYGVFGRSAARRARLYELAVAKALDLPLTDGVNAPTVNIGPGLFRTALLSLAMLGTGAGGAIGIGALMQKANVPPVPQVPVMQAQEYEVRFWTDDGTQLDVQQIKEGEK